MSWLDHVETDEPVTLTHDCFIAIMPQCNNPETWVDVLDLGLSRAGFTTAHHMALFLAQIGHESSDCTRLEENLNYAASALVPVFGTNQILADAAMRLGRVSGRPADQAGIANDVYGDAWGRKHLGNTLPGDGWKYRGRGLIQLTGRANYTRCSEATGLNLVDYPDTLLTDPQAAVTSALWFWETYVTGSDIKTTTRQINGGYHGLEDRVARYKRALTALQN